jgi:CRP-like cAMP-binding protein
MYEVLRNHIAKFITLSDDEFSRASKMFIPKKVRKKQFLLQSGEVDDVIIFVNKGCLRSYKIDDNGEEHVIQFAIEEWWISDLCSYLGSTPAHYTIDALEDSELLLLKRSSYDQLFDEVPKFDRFFRLLLQKNYIASSWRITEFISLSAEARYLHFMKNYPQIANRVPQLHIASYLGITPEALSRIRKHLAEK